MTRLFAKERIAKLRQKQESSFTPIFLHRPLAILFLIPTADIAWVTPNRITFVSTIMRFITAALLWPEAMGGIHETPATLWTAILLWHLGSVFDAMDGALARYRGTSSAFGRFIDKVPDRMIALALVLSISARAYVETNEVLYVLLGMVYVSMSGITSTAKWIDLGIRADLTGATKAVDPIERPAPERTPMQWVLYALWSLRTIIVVTEMDLPLWGTLAVLFQKETLLLSYLAIFIVPYTFGITFKRARGIWKLEQARNARTTPNAS